MSRIGAILLAAGESRRMGDLNKLSLPVDGEPLLVRSARVLLASRVASVTVVLGHQARELRRLLAGLPVRVMPTTSRHYIVDLDTPDDVRRLEMGTL